MIKLFRKIRQKLIVENKFNKYILYAVGEILLVVVGILIALQINNWNEQRKINIEEISSLNGFKFDLENDLASLGKVIPTLKLFKNSTKIILEYMEQDLPWHDSLAYHFGLTEFCWPVTFTNSSYESLSSKDWTIISNEKLRKGLIDYNRNTSDVIYRQELYERELFEISRNIWNTRFHSFWETDYDNWSKTNNFESWESYDPKELTVTKKPLNFELLKTDNEYRYSLLRLLNISNFNREFQLMNMKVKAEKLIKMIDNELGNE